MKGSQKKAPYVGPRPFERQDKKIFFGRDREINELLSLVFAHRTLLLYAQSGSGKTSLINAGLIPALEKEGFDVLPVARVRGLIPEGTKLNDVEKIYIFNTLVSWAKDKIDTKRLLKMSLGSFLNKKEHLFDEEGLPLPRVIIFDQFEELFSFYPERWKEREDFFRQVASALEADPLLRVIFVIREDYLASLDSFTKFLPEQLRARYRMECLGRKAACEAIEGPLSGTEHSFGKGVAPRLAEQLLAGGEYIEPVQLQVVCQDLWDRIQEENVKVITSKHLKKVDIEKVLKNFYEKTIVQLVKKKLSEEKDLRIWFDKQLITAAGTRGTVFRGQKHTGGIPNAAVDALEDAHLVRAEMRAGAHWYELTHDRLIEPIRKSNEVWLRDWREEEQNRRIEAERKRAEEARLQAEKQTRIAKRLRLLTTALFVMFVVAVGFALHAHRQSKRAAAAEKQAYLQAAEANWQRLLSEVESERAKRQKYYASKSEEKYKQQVLEHSSDLTKVAERFRDDKEFVIETLEKAISLDPKSAKAHRILEQAYQEQEEYDKPIKALQKAVEMEPSERTYAKLGETYKSIGKDSAAVKTYCDLGQTYQDKGEYNKAIEAFQKAIYIEPDKWTYAHLGGAYRQNKEYDSAIANLDKAISLDPQYAWAYRELGLTYRDKEDYNKAIESFQEAIKIEPTSWTYAQIGMSYRLNKEYDSAIANLDKAISLDPQYAWAYRELGLTYRDKEDYNEAIESFQEAIKIEPTSWTYAQLGGAYRQNKEYNSAIVNLDKAISLDPLYVWPYQELGLTYMDKEDYSKAIEPFQEVIKIEPDEWTYSQLGFIYHEHKFEYESAYDCYKKVLEINPNDLSNKTNFVEANLSTGRFKEAYELAQEVLDELDPKQPLYYQLCVRFFILYSLVLQGNTDKAHKSLEKFIDYYKSVADTYDSAWTYKGTRHFIGQREMDTNHEKLLLKLIDILEKPTPDITIEQFRNLL